MTLFTTLETRDLPELRLHRKVLMIVVGACLSVLSLSGVAADEHDWRVRVGAHNVAPKSDNHDVVNVDAAAMLTFTVTRFLTDQWAVELLAALPFKHDIDLNGGSRVGSTRHLPPTLSAQYHFNRGGSFQPYVGAGLNVTLFFDESTTGALDDNRLSLGTSVGPAAQIGFDLKVTPKLLANLEFRYMDIDTKAKLDGTSIGKVRVDPWLVGLSLGTTF